MSSPIRHELEHAMEQVRAQQRTAGDLRQELKNLSTTVTSADRTVTVTVDAGGELTELKLVGERYRSLAPADFCNRVVQAVRAAQDQALAKAAGLMSSRVSADLVPDVEALRGGEFRFDEMLDAARRRLDSLSFLVPDEPRESPDEQ